METYKKNKKSLPIRLFLIINNVDLKNDNRSIENHSEFFGCRNSCNKFVSIRSWSTLKLPMMLLWKAVVLEMGVQGLQAYPKKFWFAENLGKSPEYPGKNGAQHCLASENGAQSLHKNTWRPFLEVTPKWSLWGEICRQTLHTKLFGQVLGNSAKTFVPQKIACSYTLMMKRHLHPVDTLLKGQRGNGLAMPPVSSVPVHIILHAFSLLVVTGYNVSL